MQLFVKSQIDEAEAPFAQQLHDPISTDSFGQFWRYSVGDQRSQIAVDCGRPFRWIAFAHVRMRCCCKSLWHAESAASASILSTSGHTSTVLGVQAAAGRFFLRSDENSNLTLTPIPPPTGTA